MCATPTGSCDFWGTRTPALKVVYNPLTDIHFTSINMSKSKNVTDLQALEWVQDV